MIIGIDAREGVRKQRAGKGEYVYQLVNKLILHSEHQFILFIDDDLPLEWRLPNVKAVVIKTRVLLWQFKVFLYLELKRPVDVYFSTTSLILPALVRSVPVVTAIMDFISFIFPDQHNSKAVMLERIWMRPALRYSRKIIAISEHTKQDAIKLFGINPNKINVTHLAASFSYPKEVFPLPYSEIILCVGTLEPRKNLERVVEAFNIIKPEFSLAQLVLVGRWGWYKEKLQQAIMQSPYQKDIHILNQVTSTQKQSIYEQAEILVFPSLYEGFGLPPLEAMTVGVPVIASRISSIPEVVGDAGILVDPYNTPEIAEAMKQVLQNNSLRAELKIKGIERAKLFTWENTANQTLKILQEVGK